MTSENKSRVINTFQPGDTPSAQEFEALIDLATHASEIDQGTLANKHLPKNIDLTEDGTGEISSVKASTFHGSFHGIGSDLEQLDAAAIALGTLDNDRLPKNIDLTKEETGETSSMKASTFHGTFHGIGSDLEQLDAAAITWGTLDNGRLSKHIDLTLDEGITSSIKADTLSGIGTELQQLNASEITQGTLNSHRLPKFIDLTDDGNDQSSVMKASRFEGDGSALTGLNAANVQTGILSNERLNQATKLQYGIARFATPSEMENGADNLAVTPQYLKEELIATKAYVDSQLALLEAGIKFKKGVACVVTEPFNLSEGIGFPIIDGYQIVEGDRVLFVAQLDPQENKVWIASANLTWQLADDFDSIPENELFIGLSVDVQNGDQHQHSIWTVIAIDVVEGAVALTWQLRNDINNYQGGSGINVDGLLISADPNWMEQFVSDISINTTQLAGTIDNAQLPAQISEKQFSGDGSGLTQLPASELSGTLSPNVSLSLEHLFEFRSQAEFDAGNTAIPSGKILAIYVDG